MADAEVELVAEKRMDAGHRRSFFGLDKVGHRGLRRVRKLFPKKARDKLATPVNQLLSLVCDLGCLSFRAYNDPSSPGFDELTTTGCRLRHLNYAILKDSVEGVLKIFLQRAHNVLDADFGPGRSDPYVVFSTGWSQVASATVKDDDNPVWNSTHYLLIRKPGVVKRNDRHLQIRLFDSDTAWGDNAERVFRQFLIRDDFLGSAKIDMAELKELGAEKRHKVQLHLEGDRRKQKTDVVFTTEFMTFEDACVEWGKEEGSDAWSKQLEDNAEFRWTELPVDTHVGHITFQPLAYINCMRTGTQVWLHANKEEKAVAVAFRGTEANRLKDLITDLSFFPSKLRWANDGSCKLRLRQHVLDSRLRVHSGVRTAYQSVWSTVLTVVENITSWQSDWTLCITGHSLGGALATLCAFEYANREDAAGQTPKTVMMNFGAPRIGNREFVRVHRITVPESYRIVNRLDIIHKIPTFLKHVPREITFEEDGDVVVDGRQHIEIEHDSPDPEDVELPDHAPAEKLTKKALFKTPGFRGHFENYYFSVVTRAIVALFKDQKNHLHHLIEGLKGSTDHSECDKEDAKEGQRPAAVQSSGSVQN